MEQGLKLPGVPFGSLRCSLSCFLLLMSLPPLTRRKSLTLCTSAAQGHMFAHSLASLSATSCLSVIVMNGVYKDGIASAKEGRERTGQE